MITLHRNNSWLWEKPQSLRTTKKMLKECGIEKDWCGMEIKDGAILPPNVFDFLQTHIHVEELRKKYNFGIDEETKDEIIYCDKDRFKDIYNEIKQSFKRAVTKGKFVFSYREYPNDYAYWCITFKEGNETYDFIVDDFTPKSGREMSDFPKFKDVVEMSFWSGANGEVYKKKGNFSLKINSGFLMF